MFLNLAQSAFIVMPEKIRQTAFTNKLNKPSSNTIKKAIGVLCAYMDI